jgi:hypothetical protein
MILDWYSERAAFSRDPPLGAALAIKMEKKCSSQPHRAIKIRMGLVRRLNSASETFFSPPRKISARLRTKHLLIGVQPNDVRLSIIHFQSRWHLSPSFTIWISGGQAVLLEQLRKLPGAASFDQH